MNGHYNKNKKSKYANCYPETSSLAEEYVSHIIRKTFYDNHCYMNNNKEKKGNHAKEVQTTGHLTSPEYSRVSRKSNTYGWRHGSTSCNHKWSQQKNNTKVRQLLYWVVWVTNRWKVETCVYHCRVKSLWDYCP